MISKYKIKCPNCKNKNIIKWGKRKTNCRGKIQRFRCKDCSETFVNDSFKRMRNNHGKITCALDLFYRGLSTRDIQNHFKSFFPHNSDHSTILRWIRKYALIISKFTDNIELKVGYELQIDEMEYQRRRDSFKRGVDKNWFIDCIDTKTRFMVHSAFVKSRGQEEIIGILNKAKNKTENQVTKVTTDGYTAYENAVRKSFGLVQKNKYFGVVHNKVNASKGEGFNIMIERLHNTMRQRTKGFRGLHGSIESAYSIMKGLEIYYNFIRKHEALRNKTPSDIATNLKFKSPNRWLELIKMAS